MLKTLSDIQHQVAVRIASAPASHKVTWDDVIRFARELGVPCTRQWLHANEVVKAAYKARHDPKEVFGGLKAPGDPSESVKALKHKILELSASLDAYDARLTKYIFNAQRRGLTIVDLEEPIPSRIKSPKTQKTATKKGRTAAA